jgi:acyl carrier protein
MNVTSDETKQLIKTHIADQFLGGNADDLDDTTLLVSDGLLDSLGSLKLVAWIEERFGVRIEAHEVDVEHLDTLDSITAMIVSKRG